MENLNNPVEDKIEDPIVEDAPVAETPVVEAPEVEEVATEPVKEEEPKAEEPSAISTNDFGRSTSEQQAVGSVANGAIGVTSAPKPAAKAPFRAPGLSTIAANGLASRAPRPVPGLARPPPPGCA